MWFAVPTRPVRRWPCDFRLAISAEQVFTMVAICSASRGGEGEFRTSAQESLSADPVLTWTGRLPWWRLATSLTQPAKIRTMMESI